MIELFMLLITPNEINPPNVAFKYLLKDQFIDYQTCTEYVSKNIYSKTGEEYYDGIFYKIDDKEYKVALTYCKPIDK
tara:strand:+ start:279 stop:509 length:231 start_codon:yes stop_codon:yes gene_type:complete